VTYVFMAIHYPEPGRRADLYRRMADMAESIHGGQRRAQRHHPRVGGPAARVSPPDSARSVVPRA